MLLAFDIQTDGRFPTYLSAVQRDGAHVDAFSTFIKPQDWDLASFADGRVAAKRGIPFRSAMAVIVHWCSNVNEGVVVHGLDAHLELLGRLGGKLEWLRPGLVRVCTMVGAKPYCRITKTNPQGDDDFAEPTLHQATGFYGLAETGARAVLAIHDIQRAAGIDEAA